jgi:hypothetical protein
MLQLTRISLLLSTLAAGDAAALVLTPNSSGGSELVFFVGGGALEGRTTGYSLDLGVQLSQFNGAVSQSWALGAGFSIFLDPNRYDNFSVDENGIQGCNGFTAPTICGAPDLSDPQHPDFGFGVVQWGVIAADSASGSSAVLTTWGFDNDFNSTNDGDGDLFTAPVSDDGVVSGSAQVLESRWADDGANQQVRLNERPGHANAGNGEDNYRYEDGFTDPQGNLSNPGGSSLNDPNGSNPVTAQGQLNNQSRNNFFGPGLFDGAGVGGAGDLLNFAPAVDMNDAVPMYLFREGVANAEAMGDGQNIGLWFIDYERLELRYVVNGSSAVPLPAAAYLFIAALPTLYRRRRSILA